MEDVAGGAGEATLGHKLLIFKQREKGLCCLNLVIVLIYMDLQLYSCSLWLQFKFILAVPGDFLSFPFRLLMWFYTRCPQDCGDIPSPSGGSCGPQGAEHTSLQRPKRSRQGNALRLLRASP